MNIEINTHNYKDGNTLGNVIVLWTFIVFFCAAQFLHIAKYKLVLYQDIRVDFCMTEINNMTSLKKKIQFDSLFSTL